MTLKELYNLKKYERTKYGVKEDPAKLLGMLLLSDIDNYEAIKDATGVFYLAYKMEIDEQMDKVESDFFYTKEDIEKFIEDKTGYFCENFENERIWELYSEGFSALLWGLMYEKDNTPEEIYSKYFKDNDLEKHYSIEQKAISNDIEITGLDTLIDRVINLREDFYSEIGRIMTTEERDFIISCIKNKNCFNCTNENCSRDIFNNNCDSWKNDELIGKVKVLKY